MLQKLKENFVKIDKKILEVMNLGIKCCFCLTIFAILILLTYEFVLKAPNLYYSGLLLFKSSLFFFVDFIVCGFAIDTIKKEIV